MVATAAVASISRGATGAGRGGAGPTGVGVEKA